MIYSNFERTVELSLKILNLACRKFKNNLYSIKLPIFIDLNTYLT